jgi:hypothetical protein
VPKRDNTEEVRPDASPKADWSGIDLHAPGCLIGVLLQLARETGGAFIPSTDRAIMDSRMLGKCMRLSAKQVNDYLSANEIPVIKPGNKQFVDVDEFAAHLPRGRDGKARKTRKR